LAVDAEALLLTEEETSLEEEETGLREVFQPKAGLPLDDWVVLDKIDLLLCLDPETVPELTALLVLAMDILFLDEDLVESREAVEEEALNLCLVGLEEMCSWELPSVSAERD
jgi:hypothetical protein